jgi:CubicO group peptidase (beta-lactamase class C family)
MKRFYIVVALICICIAAHADSVDDIVRRAMNRQHIAGLSLAIIKDGKIIKAAGYGFANVEKKIPATPETIYELASVSKQFVAAGTMLLVEQGKVKLDDPIAKYLHNTPVKWTNVTVRRLLSHTAGFKRDDPLGLGSNPTDAELLEAIAKMPLQSEPGKEWSYSNAGFNLWSFALAEQVNESWDKYLAEKIFNPLHMENTQHIPTRPTGTNFATGYMTNRLGDWRRAPKTERTFASGGIASTVLDMAKWDAALYTEQIIKHSSFDTLITPAKLSTGDPVKTKTGWSYGLGWGVGTTIDGHKAMSHNGSRPGFSTYIMRCYEDKLTVVILCNEWHADLALLGRRIAAEYLPK